MPSMVEVDEIHEKTADSGVTIKDDLKLSSGNAIKQADGTSLLTEAGALGSSVVFPAGHVLQVKKVQTGALVTGSTAGPYLDDTIPQNTEGDQVLSLEFDPISATNQLEISVQITVGADGGSVMAALFQDSTANALASCLQYIAVADTMWNIGFIHTMVAGTASPTTFKLRVGTQISHTISLNGVSEGRIHGGSCISSMVIKEYEL